MKVAFIVPKDDDRHSPLSQFAQCRVLPPVGLARMAGLAGKRGSVVVVDERIASAKHQRHAQIAVIFVNSYNSFRAHELARQYKQYGSHVVFTGPKLMQSPDETERAERYADSLFMGSAEDNMPIFLSDFIAGKAKRFYHESANKTNQSRNPFIDDDVNWSLAS